MKKYGLSMLVMFCALSILALPACAAAANDLPAAGPAPVRTTALAGTFPDVPDGAWYAEAVEYCVEQGMMSGHAEGAFSPNDPITRSMLATVLHRMAGSPAAANGPAFTDAAPDAWYSGGIAWASAAGILSGYGDGRFGVDDPVTREQLATILWRYDGSAAVGAAQAFSDEETIADWALPAVRWARAGGIVSGKTGNRFDPQASVTRGEVATLLYHYLEPSTEDVQTPSRDMLMISVGDRRFLATLEDNATARAWIEMLPMTVNMDELNGNEKFHDLPEALPTASEQPGSIQTGDLMLYGADCLVLFYESFTSPYSYTRLGRMEDPDGLAQALGTGRVEVTFQLQTAAGREPAQK